jgi:1-acyl-sn-glycerol-3-phosphate acyltransferase
MDRSNRMLYGLYQVWKYVVVGPCVVLSTVAFGVVAVLLAMVGQVRLASRLCGGGWARVNAAITPMLVSVKGRDNMVSGQSYVIVSNHQSQYDIFVLYGWLGVDFKWVMKKELRTVPVIGYACDRLGHIFIDRTDRAAALRTLTEARERIVNGTSVLFFPEGTRSRDGRLGQFKKGAFRMALDLELPILPVTIAGTKTILPPRTSKLFPGRARMTIHPPITTTGRSIEDLKELMDETRDTVASALAPDEV